MKNKECDEVRFVELNAERAIPPSSNAWSIKWGLRGMLVSDGDKKPHLINCEAICVHEEGARIQQSWIRGFRMSALHVSLRSGLSIRAEYDVGFISMAELLPYLQSFSSLPHPSCAFQKETNFTISYR